MAVALVLLYQIPKKDAAGTVLKAHFGGSGHPLSNFGFRHPAVGPVRLHRDHHQPGRRRRGHDDLQAMKVSAGVARTQRSDYFAELGDPDVKENVAEIGRRHRTRFADGLPACRE